MLSYVYFGTNDLERATRFYDATLTQLGMQRCGLRPHYSADSYAAYVLDPDGNKVAAVCRGFTGPQWKAANTALTESTS
jgi:catechol 2,3-dioxygenase-like lactoylglutathione lyase family enzyme